jgi:hypothetical protein
MIKTFTITAPADHIKFVRIKDDDLLKSIFLIAVENNVSMSEIILMAFMQKTWTRCRRKKIFHPTLGNEDWLYEKTMILYPHFMLGNRNMYEKWVDQKKMKGDL